MKGKRMAAAAIAAGALVASPAFAVCDNCGSVSDVKTIKKEGEASGVGAKADKSQKSTTSYKVTVKMENGATRTFDYGTPTAYKVGDRVKIVDKKLVRQ